VSSTSDYGQIVVSCFFALSKEYVCATRKVTGATPCSKMHSSAMALMSHTLLDVITYSPLQWTRIKLYKPTQQNTPPPHLEVIQQQYKYWTISCSKGIVSKFYLWFREIFLMNLLATHNVIIYECSNKPIATMSDSEHLESGNGTTDEISKIFLFRM